MKIDVVLSPAEIDALPARDLSETTCVVFDVLRATSSMITALANGVREIYPAKTIEEAYQLQLRFPDALLGGERHGDKIDGFDLGNSPLEYRRLTAARVIMTTTNGTIALRACENSREVLVGALLNIGALTIYLRQKSPANLLLVCAGTFREAALEDALAAGMICAAFPDTERSDSAKITASVFRRYEQGVLHGLESSRNGAVLMSKGRKEDVHWCARKSLYGVIGGMAEGVIRTI